MKTNYFVNHIPSINISDYDYSLPESRIAKFPLSKRDSSKLLIYKGKTITQATFKDIVNLIEPASTVVFNNTKVVQARLHFKKKTGATIEVFLLEPLDPADYAISFSSTQKCKWKCIVGNLKRWKDEILESPIVTSQSFLHAKKVCKIGESVEIEFSWNDSSLSFARVIELCGEVSIPPYLNRNPDECDKTTYQTIYAKPEGSVAAPTAGLHFTAEIINSIQKNGVNIEFLTLHVGAGTFKPVKSDIIADHEMHTEHFFVSKELINQIRNCTGSILSVGTTSLRTLESLYWLGVKLHTDVLDRKNPFIGQWEPYNLPQDVELSHSLDLIDKWMINENKNFISASTQLCITPGYKFRVVDNLITNYHQPRSTLLLLVAAFIGDDWKRVYSYALENEFRFLSYGDSSILFRNKTNEQ